MSLKPSTRALIKAGKRSYIGAAKKRGTILRQSMAKAYKAVKAKKGRDFLKDKYLTAHDVP